LASKKQTILAYYSYLNIQGTRISQSVPLFLFQVQQVSLSSLPNTTPASCFGRPMPAIKPRNHCLKPRLKQTSTPSPARYRLSATT